MITIIISGECQNREGSFLAKAVLVKLFVLSLFFLFDVVFLLFICLLFILPFLFCSLWESDVLSVFHCTHFCLFRFCVGVTCVRLIVFCFCFYQKFHAIF